MAKKKATTAEVATATPKVSKPKRSAKKTVTYSGKKWTVAYETPDGMVMLFREGEYIIVSPEEI